MANNAQNRFQKAATGIINAKGFKDSAETSRNIKDVFRKCLSDYDTYLDTLELKVVNTVSNKAGFAIQRPGITLKEPQEIDVSETKKILKNMMFSKEELEKILRDLELEIKTLVQTKVTDICSLVDENKKWVDCLGKCQTIISTYFNMELNSIAYLLRVINSSNISITPGTPLSFTLVKNFFGNNTLTPSETKQLSKKLNWDIFSSNLTLNIKDELSNPSNPSNPSKPSKPKKARLIMGFGPSASGKTYSAQSIIRMLKLIEDDFPEVFMTIDGGKYREKSILYRFIVDLLKAYGLSGLNNMKISSVNLKKIKLKTLFDSTNVKKIIGTFLKQQKSKGLNFSLYIPETLGKCNNLNLLRLQTCKNQYDKYIKLTGDQEWIGLYIYQHIHDSECIYPPPFNCEGTSKAGKSREVDEGKKFSNKSYYTSEYFGLTELIKAPNSYKIHNGGIKGRFSIIEDLNGTKTNFTQFLQPELNISLNKKIHKFVNDRTKKPIPELEGFRYFKNIMECRTVKDLEENNPLAQQDPNENTNDTTSSARKYLKYKMKYLKLKKDFNIN